MPIAMRRRACASGAARPWSAPMSRRSRCGSIGPLPRGRTRCRKRRDSLQPCLRAMATACTWDRALAENLKVTKPEAAMSPNVLISRALYPAAVQNFKDSGITVDIEPKIGADKEQLAKVIRDSDGLAIRSATKVTPKVLEKAKRLKVIGRAGIGVDNVDIPAATAKGVIVMNTPFGNSITTAEHAITLMLALARQIPQADASTQAG